MYTRQNPFKIESIGNKEYLIEVFQENEVSEFILVRANTAVGAFMTWENQDILNKIPVNMCMQVIKITEESIWMRYFGIN